MGFKKVIVVMGFMGGLLAIPSIASASVTAPAPLPSPAADTPQTVKDALQNTAYLSKFDSVDLSTSAGNTPVIDGRAVSSSSKQASSAAVAAAASSCKWTAFTALFGGYGPVSSGCGIAGYSGYKKPYSWTYGSAASICALGIGYNSSNTATWYYTGCGGGSYTVPWGNNLATSKFKVSGPYLNMLAVDWSS